MTVYIRSHELYAPEPRCLQIKIIQKSSRGGFPLTGGSIDKYPVITKLGIHISRHIPSEIVYRLLRARKQGCRCISGSVGIFLIENFDNGSKIRRGIVVFQTTHIDRENLRSHDHELFSGDILIRGNLVACPEIYEL